MKENLAVYVTDAGSVSKGNFHWVSSNRPEGESNDITALVAALCEDIRNAKRVALGFECPLFVPCPGDHTLLGVARPGETDPAFSSRPFNAGAGASVALTGLQAHCWVLREVRSGFPAVRATTRWAEFLAGTCQLFLWEAFVSGSEKGERHHEDAVLALRAFEMSLDRMATASRIGGESPVSLAGAAILWAGLSSDLTLLHSPCVVLRPIFTEEEAARRLRLWKEKAKKKRRLKRSQTGAGKQTSAGLTQAKE